MSETTDATSVRVHRETREDLRDLQYELAEPEENKVSADAAIRHLLTEHQDS